MSNKVVEAVVDEWNEDTRKSKEGSTSLLNALLYADFKKMMRNYIGKAFDNERAFIKRFFTAEGSAELLECYMASERTRIHVLTDSGATVTTTIQTDEFVEWCENI